MTLPVNEIVCGDCLEVMKEWLDNCVDLVLTDPPYGIGIVYDKFDDTPEMLLRTLLQTVPICQRLSDRSLFFSGIRNFWAYPLPDWIVAYAWVTTACYGQFGVNQWTPVACYGKDIEGFGSVNGELKTDLIYFSGGGGVGFGRLDCEKNFHPTPKPLNVMLRFVRRFSLPDNLILDPFCGSGTTCVAAKMLGRRYIGIDISEKYCEIARMRLEAVETGVPVRERQRGQKGLFEK